MAKDDTLAEMERTYRELHDQEVALDKPPSTEDLNEHIEYLQAEIIALQNRVSVLEKGGEA